MIPGSGACELGLTTGPNGTIRSHNAEHLSWEGLARSVDGGGSEGLCRLRKIDIGTNSTNMVPSQDGAIATTDQLRLSFGRPPRYPSVTNASVRTTILHIYLARQIRSPVVALRYSVHHLSKSELKRNAYMWIIRTTRTSSFSCRARACYKLRLTANFGLDTTKETALMSLTGSSRRDWFRAGALTIVELACNAGSIV